MLTMLKPDMNHAVAIRCYGSQDERGAPICDGPDVRHVRVQPLDGPVFHTNWCADCRADATVDGTMIVADVLPSVTYAQRLERAIAALGSPNAELVLAPYREAVAL